MMSNKGVIFTKIPTSNVIIGEHLVVKDVPFDPEAPPPTGGLTFKLLHASLDPYMRGCMRPAHIKSYVPPFIVGQPIVVRSIGKVLKSAHASFKEGDVIVLPAPLQEYAALPGDSALLSMAQLVENPYGFDLKTFLGVLGMPGLTAYSSLYEIGKPQKGETIFISAAAGAVGAMVGQLAKAEGLKVIGSVGSDAKLDYIVKELGFDAGFNYKKESPADALARLAPEGLDIYYENVGGEHLIAALNAMKKFGRIVACGMISQYNKKPEDLTGIPNLMLVVGKSLTIRGFIQADANMGPLYVKERDAKISKWLREGTFKAKTTDYYGIDNGPKALTDLFEGANVGKTILTLVS